MNVLSTEFQKPARKANRASRAAARTAEATARAVAAEARVFGKKSAKHLKTGAAKGAKHVRAVRGAGDDAVDIARARLGDALEALQQSSAEMSRWAGARANAARDQAQVMVRERPLGSLGSVLAIGALAGLLMSLMFRRD